MTDDPRPTDHERLAEWDGAYVLGALSPADRRLFEAHLETCDRCRLAVADLSGLPGLLGRVDRDRAFSLLEPATAELVAVPPPPADLVARIERAERRRRTRRLRIVALVAAVAVVVCAVAVPAAIVAQPHPVTEQVALGAAEKSPLSAQVQLTSVAWGTRLDMHCAYGTENAWGDAADEGDWSYALWVVDAHGTASQVSTWKATSGSQVRLTAGTALALDQIAAVQVRSATTGDVLLTKKL